MVKQFLGRMIWEQLQINTTENTNENERKENNMGVYRARVILDEEYDDIRKTLTNKSRIRQLENELEEIEVTIKKLDLALQWYKNQLAFIKSKLEDAREKVEQ